MNCNRATLCMTILGAVLIAIGCNRTETPSAGEAKPAAQAPANSAAVAPSTGQESTAWIAASRSWPDTLRWNFDSAFEHRQDGLLMRLRMIAAQDFIPGDYKDTHPLQCIVNLTLRPIPEWPLARGLSIDSVIFHDPIRNKTFPSLPILAAERNYESQTVRTRFLNAMSKPYVPTLTENQVLHPTLYLHWEKRVIVAALPPVPVGFLREAAETIE
ncbi:MAG: hypothetical protein HZB43_02905 [candidate division Zixibacteria bacterium]|nr:hypothetical protein [candidate division Zixibacteria bacterium]